MKICNDLNKTDCTNCYHSHIHEEIATCQTPCRKLGWDNIIFTGCRDEP